MQRRSAPPAMPMPELRDRTESLEAQSPQRQGGGAGICPLTSCPRDIIMSILDQMRPVGSLTTYESTADKPVVRPSHIERRTSLLNVSLSCREFYGLAIPYLYRNPLIKDRRELFRFFSTLATRADRRQMIRSFAWVGVLWVGDIIPESSMSHLLEETSLAAECWSSIKSEWPREAIDHDIAIFCEYEFSSLGYVCFLASMLQASFQQVSSTCLHPG